MKDEVIGVEAVSDPFFIGKSGVLLDYLRSLSLAQLKKRLPAMMHWPCRILNAMQRWI